jgi:hypothetical protein
VSLERTTYLTAVCDNCGPDWWDDGTAEGPPLFTSKAAARRSLAADYQWRIVQQITGRFRMVCGTCGDKEDCEQFGHQWKVADLDPTVPSPPRATPIELCRRCAVVRREDTPPIDHPESMTVLSEGDEEILAEFEAELFTKEAS